MFTDAGPGNAVTLNDVYAPAVTTSSGGGVQVATDTGGNATGFGNGASQASPTGVTLTWGVGVTLAVLAYLFLARQG